MIFEPLPPYEDILMWGAMKGNYSFVISDENGEIRASVKVLGTRPFDNTRLDLGVFNSIQQAIDACNKWKPE